MGKPYDDTAYKNRRAALKRRCAAVDAPCYLCGGKILYDADRRHPQAFEADHVESLQSGGKVLGALMPSCKRCNGAKQGMSLDQFREKRAARQPSPVRRTTRW